MCRSVLGESHETKTSILCMICVGSRTCLAHNPYHCMWKLKPLELFNRHMAQEQKSPAERCILVVNKRPGGKAHLMRSDVAQLPLKYRFVECGWRCHTPLKSVLFTASVDKLRHDDVKCQRCFPEAKAKTTDDRQEVDGNLDPIEQFD